jgi:ATP-dependent exoDNAse (exonuclease V) alpha subunit
MTPNDQMAEPSAIKRIVKRFGALIVDEISMVGSQMWLALASVRAQAPEMLILLVGDWRQLGAIESSAIYKSGFCGHPILDYITNSTRIGLEYSKSCRNDPTLQKISDHADDVASVKAATSKDRSAKTLNIAFTNKMVAEINHQVLATELPKTLVAERHVLDNAPADWVNADQPSAKKAWANAAWTLARGQPMMLEKFNKYSKHPKNTTLVIEAADANNITIAATNGIGSFKIPTEHFWELLRPAYCLTTHKSQCETYHQPYNIYEYWRMDTRMRYTALTRAKTAGQITIM